MISIFILTYNEEVLLSFTINFYRTRFPGCLITLYDNESTDSTHQIAKDHNCQIITYNTNNQIVDTMFQKIKNSCYKSSKEPWALVCDADELLDISLEQLQREDRLNNTLIRSQAYHMVNHSDNPSPETIYTGVRDKIYDKILLFKRSKCDPNYKIGAHRCKPAGKVSYSRRYPLYHYKYLSPDYLVNRYSVYKERLSQENLDNHWGGACLNTELSIRTYFQELRSKAIPLWK